MDALKNFKNKIGRVYRGVHGFLANKLDKVPLINNTIEKIIIGESTNKNPINCYKIGTGPKKIIFISAIHGNEVGTIKLSNELINWLENEKLRIKEKLQIFIIPCLNLDGYDLAKNNPDYLNGGRIGRFNGNNVDLNRNFETPGFQKESVWSFGKNYLEKEKVYCGECGNSEPETKALINLLAQENIKTLFVFHNAGKDVMSNDMPIAEKLARIYSQKTGFKLVSTSEWQELNQTGTLREWCQINNINYIEIEGSTRWGSDWNVQKQAIIEVLTKI